MADFIETGSSKSAIRVLENPIADIASFDAIISELIAQNPFECTDYVSEGQTISGIAKSRQYYTAKILFEDDDAKTIGTVSVKSPDVGAFSATAGQIMADTVLAGQIGGTPVRDTAHDAYYCQLKCHDANGEIYYVTFTRTKVRLSSYEDESIRTNVETWADTVSALA
ncbi:MAG: hypothetical protein JXQ82_00100 [Methanomicrobiaceae archaeon]|nr:hypothetical protein [Methanomicrobiaceae archaeon]